MNTTLLNRTCSILPSAVCFAVLFCSACDRRPAPSPAPVATPAPLPPSPFNFDSAFLTRARLLGYIASLVEADRLSIRASLPPNAPDPFPPGQRLVEADAFARKYGFADYMEYSAVDQRVIRGRTILLARKFNTTAVSLLEQKIQILNSRLTAPDLAPADRAEIQKELLATLEEMDTRRPRQPPSLHDADLELVKEYEPQIEAAEKALPK